MKFLKCKLIAVAALTLLLSILHPPSSAMAQNSSAFTFQGRLNDAAGAANGSYDMTFAIWDANVAGNRIAGPITNSAVAVSNGLFTAPLDFGSGVFTGTNYWVEMSVRTNGAATFVTLVPRQQLTPTPYALAAARLIGPISSLGQLPSGVVTNFASYPVLNGLWMNNQNVYLRTGGSDFNHGLGYYGSDVGKTFAGVSVGGPVLFGYSSGALGTEQSGVEHIALQWSPTAVTVNGTFNNNSDRDVKQDFTTVSSADILAKVAALPIFKWSYKSDAATRHIGPMAQDFYSSFNVGTDGRHIAPIDEGGVALTAIKALNEKLEQQNADLRNEISELKAEFKRVMQEKTR